MADSENSTFNTSRVLGNEIVKADDINFGFESLINNISKFAQMLLECDTDFVIGGNVSVASGTNIKVAPIFGVCSKTKTPFGMTSDSDVISITQDDSHSRVDILEAQGEWVTYDEQQRAFNDLDNNIVSYQNVDVKERLKVIYRVKMGTNDSVTAPTTDEGWVKIAEIKYTKGKTELSESDILNITSDVSGLENSLWTNEKTKTYNINYISQVNERFRQEHNADGSHKSKVIKASNIDFGTLSNQVNAANIAITQSGTVGSATYNVGDTVTQTFVTFANQFATLYNAYIKNGAYNFNGEIALSKLLGTNNKLTKPLILGSAGDGTAYCKIDTKTIFTITSDGKIRMASGYNPTDANDLVPKSVTDSISSDITNVSNRVTTLENQTKESNEYVNDLLNRFSYINGKIYVATTDNITLNGLQTVDGISLSAGDIILVKNQTDKKQNGIYEVNANTWQRHSEFSTFDLIKHKFFKISAGTSNKDKIFYTPQETYSGNLGENELKFSEYPIKDSSNALLTSLLEGNSNTDPKDDNYFIGSNINDDGTVDKTSFVRRKISTLWNYIKNKIDNAYESLIAHPSDTTNPHSVTKEQVGLGNCDNTADKDKSVNSATTAGSAGIPTGFSYRSTTDIWGAGNQIGTQVTGWGTANGGSLTFRENGDSTNKQLNQVIDGVYYQNEGNYKVVDENSIGSLNAGSAIKSSYIIDSANTDKIIEIAYANTGLTSSTATHFAAFGAPEHSGTEKTIRDLSVAEAKKLLGVDNVMHYSGEITKAETDTFPASLWNESKIITGDWAGWTGSIWKWVTGGSNSSFLIRICGNGGGDEQVQFAYGIDNNRFGGSGWSTFASLNTEQTFSASKHFTSAVNFSGTLVIPTTSSTTNGAIWIG